MTKTTCDRCSNELLPGYFQCKVDKVYDLCETCKDALAAWLKVKADG